MDFILTHTAPKSIIEKLNLEFNINPKKILDPTALYLENIYKKVKFKEWHFGHFHLHWFYRDVKNREFYCHYKSNQINYP